MVSCIHLGEHIGDTRIAKKQCGSCRHWTAVFSCELHQICTPIKPSQDTNIRDCRKCEHRENMRKAG